MKIKAAIMVAMASLAIATSPAQAAAVGDPPPPAVPTPALLPGLIGMGLGILRKRNQAEQ